MWFIHSKNLNEYFFKESVTHRYLTIQPATQGLSIFSWEIEFMERLGLPWSQPRSPSKLQHLHLQEIMQNSARFPALFGYRIKQYILQHPHLHFFFPFFHSQPSTSLPIETPWFLRPISDTCSPPVVRRQWDEGNIPASSLSEQQASFKGPSRRLSRHSTPESETSLQLRFWRKRGTRRNVPGFHPFLWLYTKYCLEFLRVGKLTTERSQKSAGQQRCSDGAHFFLSHNQGLLASAGTRARFSPDTKLHQGREQPSLQRCHTAKAPCSSSQHLHPRQTVLSNRIFCQDGNVLYLLVQCSSHWWRGSGSTWNVAGGTQQPNLQFPFI